MKKKIGALLLMAVLLLSNIMPVTAAGPKPRFISNYHCPNCGAYLECLGVNAGHAYCSCGNPYYLYYCTVCCNSLDHCTYYNICTSGHWGDRYQDK